MISINKKYLIFFICFTFSCTGLIAQDKPNIIIFIADDISYNDFGCYGHPLVKTPNIDKLAENGIRFHNAFLTTSSCSPSRASIIMGRYPHNTGAAELHSNIPDNQVAFPKLLKEAGYYTAQAGKWHLGPFATKQGDAMHGVFDRAGGDSERGGGASGAEKWVEYLKQRPKNKPFFMWFAAHDAHRDWDNEPIPIKYKASEVIVSPHLRDTEKTREDLASYYNEVSRFDYFIGEAIKELEDQNILKNTLVIVMADNGRPFPRNKTRMYDEGIKTPLIIHWPNGINRKGVLSKSMLSVIDIAPTILDIAAIKTVPNFQGQSFKQVLLDPNKKFRKYVFAEHNWHDFKAFERMVRTEEFLYIENGLPDLDNRGAIDIMGGGAGVELQKGIENNVLTPFQKEIFLKPQPKFELYNCKKDPLQVNNVYGQKKYKKIQKNLANTLKTWQDQTGDSQPPGLTPDWYDRITNKALPSKGKRGIMPGTDKKADQNNNPGPF